MGNACGQRFGACIMVAGTLAGFVATAYCAQVVLSLPKPARDFSALLSKCAVTAVYHEASTGSRHNHATKGTDTYCYDVWTYEFAWCKDANACSPSAAPASIGDTTPRTGYSPSWSSTAVEAEVYRAWWTSFPPPAAFAYTGWESELLASEPHALYRGSGACSGTFDVSDSIHRAGDWVTCYQPSGPVHEIYACGNADCIKLRDPAADVGPGEQSALEGLYFGAGIFGIFGLCWLCSWRSQEYSCLAFCCGEDLPCVGDDSSSEEHGKTPGAA